MKNTITNEMMERLDAAIKREREWFALHGFPDYQTSDDKGGAHPAHRAWVKALEREHHVGIEGSPHGTPLARKMFVLGWLQRDAAGGGQ